ncbi:DUF5107 domain-containing protein [Devosia sp.]|uniref:DUF5107 domain-containing protein n=1 Tax=Devosia sp. TaxID=1871048 RepID=UPI001AC388EA|nr:DUF5107 domain-containing protein [Devosia sp.]MBN9307897.1 DUF5107 domain-containing protein [Devosia sp.]
MPTTITPTTRRMPMSRLGPPSSLPRFRWQQPIADTDTPPNRGLSPEESRHGFQWGKDSILPYRVFDDYDRHLVDADMELIAIGNGRLEVTVAPQLGGRLMSLRDLKRGRDLVFTNPVFQPANLAALNAWFSGGIEWNGLIPGHTPFTTARIFAGIVDTERGPILRLYEFDRIVEATWQVDLFLPADDDRLYVHGRIANAADTMKLAYWWTNVAAPMRQGMRVISPADYSIEHVLPGNELARFPFPDPARFDGSYPDRWQDATSVFFRAPTARRRYIAALDEAGFGLAEASTGALVGRKFFYFGMAPGGQQWMDYLARPGEGDYIEIQSGVAPTQNQRFELPPRTQLEWTEVYGALEVDPRKAHEPNYSIAVAATTAAIDSRFPEAALAETDRFLATAARRPVTRRLSAGSPWGARHERLTLRPLAEGLDFSVERPADAWDELSGTGRFSATALATVPTDFAVSDLWVEALEESRKAHGYTWLHALLLGIAALDRNDRPRAALLFDQSVAQKPTWLGLRQRALVATDPAAAERDYLAAWATRDAPPALAAEIVDFLVRHDRFAELEAFVSDLPDSALTDERVHLGRARVAARQGDLDLLETLLERRFATIREGEMLLDQLWNSLQHGRLREALGREPTADEVTARLKQHPVPPHLNFRMKSD